MIHRAMSHRTAAGWAAGCALFGALLGALAMYLVGPAPAPADHAPRAAEVAPAGTLKLDAGQLRQASLRIVPVSAGAFSSGQPGFARALDLAPLASSAADVTAAQAAANASRQEAARLEALVAQDQSASPRELEAARAQSAADQAKLTFACQRAGLEYGAGLARLGCGALAGLVRDAALGHAALVRIDMPGGALPAGAPVTLGNGADRVVVRVLGPAASADAQLQSPGVLALVSGPRAGRLGVGRVLPARGAGAGERGGIIIPREALLRSDGTLFVYRAEPGGRFARVDLTGGEPQDQGWFIAAGPLRPGDRIVVDGAATLLGLERAAPPEGGD